MKSGILSLILILLFSFSFAHAEQKLTPFAELKTKAREENYHAALSSFHYRLNPGVDCTGTFISNRAHFLTALHCIAGCLAKNHAIERTHAVEDPVATVRGREIFTDLMTVDEEKIDEGVSCPMQIGKRKVNAKIILTGGKGWFFPKDSLAAFAKKYPEDHQALLDSGYEHGYDFAILQIESATTPNCLTLAQQAPSTGEPLKSISFSCVDRNDTYFDGKVPLFTSGHRTAGFKTSDFYKSAGIKGLPYKTDFIDRKDTFFSSVDIEKCGSGSGLFDSQSRLAGIATRVYKSSTAYEYGAVEAVNVSQVWHELFAKMNGSQMKEVTSCKPLVMVRKPASNSKISQKVQ